MAHLVEGSPVSVSKPATAGVEHTGDPRDLPGQAPLIVSYSGVLIGGSLAITLLAAFGVADVLPAALRATVGTLGLLTLPGLPITALLRLPTNGIFASVSVSLSLAVNVLLAQANYAGHLHQPYGVQFVVLAMAAAATGLLARQWSTQRDAINLRAALRSVRRQLAPTGDRRASLLLLAVSAAMFISAVNRLDVDAAGNLGLLEVLGVEYFCGLGILCIVLAIEYRRDILDRAVIASSNVALIVYITMPVAWSMGTAPFVTAYVHRMITNWMVSLGTLPPPVDARVSWAGFFSTAANLVTTTGLEDCGILLVSASLVFGVCLMFPVYAIGLAISGDGRVAWMGVTMLILFNWYQQDYFAPQAVAMQFYATILAVLFWQLRTSRVPTYDCGRLKKLATAWMRIPGRVAGRDLVWTYVVEIIVVLILAAMVVSHQLTPLAAIAALLSFSAFGLTRYKLLWLAAAVIFIAWFFYGAAAYWQGHLGQVIADIGGVDQNLNSSVSQTLTGDSVYRRMQLLRFVAALVLMGMACVGWLRLRRAWDSNGALVAVVALAPFGLVVLQSYGGEVAIRSFLYASPVLSPLAALCVLPLTRPGTVRPVLRRLTGLLAIIVFVLTALMVTANRGLNISFERTTPHELAIAAELVSKIQSAGLGYWGQGSLYGVPHTFELEDGCFVSAEELATCTAQPNVEYFSNTVQDENFIRYSVGVSYKTTQEALDLLRTEKGYETVYDSGGILVLKRPEAPMIRLGSGT